jgi:hypothetical protein
MSPMHKSITALAAAALLATVGYATAQSTDTTTDASGAQTTTVTTTDTSTQVIPAPPTGVVDLARPRGTVAPVDKQADGALGMENSVMTTGLTNGATRPSVGDHATPPIPADPTILAVTTERTTTTTTTPIAETPAPAPAPVAAPVEAAPEPAPMVMPAPRADRN